MLRSGTYGSARSARVGQWAGVVAPSALAGLGLLHASWARGGRWPGGSDAGLAALVLSRAERDMLVRRTGRELPPVWLTWAVATGLLAAAGVAGATTAGHRSLVLRGGACAVATVLFARGAAGLLDGARHGFDERYRVLDVAVYSPLCLALAASIVQSIRRP